MISLVHAENREGGSGIGAALGPGISGGPGASVGSEIGAGAAVAGGAAWVCLSAAEGLADGEALVVSCARHEIDAITRARTSPEIRRVISRAFIKSTYLVGFPIIHPKHP
jgi:hypothetical protein